MTDSIGGRKVRIPLLCQLDLLRSDALRNVPVVDSVAARRIHDLRLSTLSLRERQLLQYKPVGDPHLPTTFNKAWNRFWEQDVGGSNPLALTNFPQTIQRFWSLPWGVRPSCVPRRGLMWLGVAARWWG